MEAAIKDRIHVDQLLSTDREEEDEKKYVGTIK